MAGWYRLVSWQASQRGGTPANEKSESSQGGCFDSEAHPQSGSETDMYLGLGEI